MDARRRCPGRAGPGRAGAYGVERRGLRGLWEAGGWMPCGMQVVVECRRRCMLYGVFYYAEEGVYLCIGRR